MPNLPEPNTDSSFEVVESATRAADTESQVTEDWPAHEPAAREFEPPAEPADIEGAAPSGPVVREGAER